MWFLGDNEQRGAGSIERLPAGPGRNRIQSPDWTQRLVSRVGALN